MTASRTPAEQPARTTLCRCGKPASHVTAAEDSQDWSCRVPLPIQPTGYEDRLLAVTQMYQVAMDAAEAALAAERRVLQRIRALAESGGVMV